MDLGKNILKLRKQLQLSQEQLGMKVGVTRQTISNWELNETVPDAKQLLALSKVLDISIDALVDNDSQSKQVQDTLPMKDASKNTHSKRTIILLSVLLILLLLAFISAS